MKSNIKKYLSICVCVFLLYLCTKYWDAFAGLVLLIISASAPLIIGCCIAYPVNILMGFYTRHWFPKSKKPLAVKSRGPVCMVAAYLSMVAIVALVVRLVLPELVSCVGLLIDVLPGYITDTVKKIQQIEYIPKFVLDSLQSIDWNSKLEQFMSVISTGVSNVASALVKALSSVFSAIVTGVIAVIFSIYLLISKEKLKTQGTCLMKTYLPEKIRDRIYYVLGVLDDSFRKYLVGQCTEALILGLLCTVGMMIFRFPYATMVGALTAFTALIPIAGAYIGAGVGAFMIMTVSPVKAILFLVFILILQQLEGNLIYPKVVGSSLGLPGIWVLVAITVGGGTFGVIGMFLGVPIFAAVYRIIREDVQRRHQPKIESEEAA